MTLEQEIASWASTRPAWQRRVLAELAAGKAFSEADCRLLASQLAASTAPESSQLPLATLAASSAIAARVRLASLEVIAHVNRLRSGQTLVFDCDGLTVVYGDNASGKSGYARIIKSVARARHQEEVLTDIFADADTAKPQARISFEVDGVAQVANWPQEEPGDLGRIHFYDRACGDAYISTESEVTYRPSVLVLFDQLIDVCDAVRSCLDDLLRANALRTRNLPKIADPTLSVFVETLGAGTRDADIESACKLPPEPDKQEAALLEEEGHLLESDPEKERDRLNQLANRLDTVAGHLATLEQSLGADCERRLREQLAGAAETRTAADVAAQTSFASEPLPGTGSPLWQAMWEAARRFSLSAAYPNEAFPVVRSGALCVLCQQDLGHEAVHRLERFAALLADTTQEQAQRAEQTLAVTRATIGAAVPLPSHVSAELALIERDEPELAADASRAIDSFSRRKTDLLGLPAVAPPTDGYPQIPDLSARSVTLRAMAKTVDAAEFRRRLDDVRKRRTELESRQALAAVRADIEAEVGRRRERAALESAKRQVDTTGITRKSTELARSYATAVTTDRFTRESDQLKLQRITLRDTGGHKGQLHQKPAFLAAKQRADMHRVLSEGEQTALGLAGFFTEAELDDSKSTLVFDDPVSSLSHVRRPRVASRIAAFARDRQVIVFTHELEFAGELAVAAERESVKVCERHIVQSPVGDPGLCLDGHPWKAKSAKQRLAQLGADLRELRREATVLQPEEYERRITDWAGQLSETWERILKEEISDQLVDPSRLEVHPKMVKVIAQVTEQDAKQFDESYSRVSRWARRHDKARSLNYVMPELTELETELKQVRQWLTKVRKYRDRH